MRLYANSLYRGGEYKVIFKLVSSKGILSNLVRDAF
jgi:hypothetical protein